MQGRRVEPTEGVIRPLLEPGDYTRLDDAWWVRLPPPDEGVTIAEGVVEHEDGTISASVSKGSVMWRIDRGHWRLER